MRAGENLRAVMRFEPIELDPVIRRLSRAANVADLRRIARRRLPSGVFDYIDGGAEDEHTLRRNVNGFRRYEFRPRVLRDASMLNTRSRLLGKEVALPLVVAPMGFVRIADPAGELALARAAARAGVPFSLSTMATRSIEEVAAVSEGPKWFQVYVWRDRGLLRELLARARAAAYDAITISVDTAVLGRRERDVRRGFTLPPKIGPGTLVDGLIHPGWTWSFLRAEPILFANVVGKGVGDGVEAVSLAQHFAEQFDPAHSWDDIGWFREQWGGPIVIKGIQTVDDARIAADIGVEAVALSNHGGRQLDGAPAPIELVEPVAQEVGGKVEIICDGGVRRGSDIVRALALGADACMVGRPFLYGLAAGGERGTDFVFDFLHSGMRQTMALVGATAVSEITRELVARRP